MPVGLESISQLSGREVGLFRVRTQKSSYSFNLQGEGRGVVTREPGAGTKRTITTSRGP
jgi:hypothetical protein